jgi:hypothetical protein
VITSQLRRSLSLVLACALAGAGLGCGGGGAKSATSSACTAAAARQLGQVAVRAYREAGHGVNVQAAVSVLKGSRPLQQAVARGDARAIQALLPHLVHGYIWRLQITRGARLLADVGSGDALAPTTGVLQDRAGSVVGSYRLAVLPDRAYADLVAHLSGGTVNISSAGRVLALGRPPGGAIVDGPGWTFNFAGVAFPSGPVQVALKIPSTLLPSTCSEAGAAAVYAAGQVAMTIYGEEASSAPVRQAVRVVQRFTPLLRSVAAGDPVGSHHALMKLLYNRMHIVRIRVLRHGKVLGDVGGPLVLGPSTAPLISNGHRVGTAVIAIQDDRGFQLLTRRFTGALTLLRIGGHQLLGQLNPGPAQLPDRGAVNYRGVRYEVFSFIAKAFPSGRLRISVLLPV